jgi:hypothetical protein
MSLIAQRSRFGLITALLISLSGLTIGCSNFESSQNSSAADLDLPPGVAVDEGRVSTQAVAPTPAPIGTGRAALTSDGHYMIAGKRAFIRGVYDSGVPDSAQQYYESTWENFLYGSARQLNGIPINVYLNYHLGGNYTKLNQLNPLMNVLQRHGTMWIQTGNCLVQWDFDPAGFSIGNNATALQQNNLTGGATFVSELKKHPALFGYYIQDECDDPLVSSTQNHTNSLHSQDPQGLTFGAPLGFMFREFGKWAPTMDVIAPDPYVLYLPCNSSTGQGCTESPDLYPHFRVAEVMAKTRMQVPASKPISAVLQFFQFGDASRLPTYQELRNHSIMAITEGVQGIFWWEIGLNGLLKRGTSPQTQYMGYLRSLVNDLAVLEPVLVAPSTTTALTGNSTRAADKTAFRIAELQRRADITNYYYYGEGQTYQSMKNQLAAGNRTNIAMLNDDVAYVRTMTKVVNGVGYVFAYNTTNTSRSATFSWYQTISSLRDFNWGSAPARSSLPFSGNSWTDSFGPYEGKVYVIGGSGTTAPSPSPSPTPTPTPSPSPSSGPYNGVAAAIPGTVQAENFDNGGEGVAYHDVDSSNNGGAYRSTGVDIQATTDSGGGYNVGWIAAGEYLKYTVSVGTSGTFSMEARVASIYTGMRFHVEVDGVNVTGTMISPNTGNWATFQSVTKTGINLSAGGHVLKFVAEDSNFNLNFLRFTQSATTSPSPSPSPSGSTPYSGTPAAVPGTIQAENFDNGGEGVAYHDLDSANYGGAYRSTGVDIQATTDSGGGYNVGWIAAGEYLKYTFSVGTSGTYNLEARIASPYSSQSIHVEVDGVNVTGAMALPNTGGWQNWQSVAKTGLNLAAGTHVLKFVADSGNINFNFLRFTQSATASPSPTGSLKVAITAPAAGSLIKGTAWATIWVEGSSTSVSKTYVATLGGKQVGSTTTTSNGPVSIPMNTTLVANGTQSLVIRVTESTGNYGQSSISVNVGN